MIRKRKPYTVSVERATKMQHCCRVLSKCIVGEMERLKFGMIRLEKSLILCSKAEDVVVQDS